MMNMDDIEKRLEMHRKLLNFKPNATFPDKQIRLEQARQVLQATQRPKQE